MPIDPEVTVHCVCGHLFGPIVLPHPIQASIDQALAMNIPGLPQFELTVACPECAAVSVRRASNFRFHTLGTLDQRQLPLDRLAVRARRVCGMEGCEVLVEIHTTVASGAKRSELDKIAEKWDFGMTNCGGTPAHYLRMWPTGEYMFDPFDIEAPR